ncbi:HD-GYP domain-containing protein (c-di-GMP phosphodiesterase class II) [Alteromonadaceae bacterium 2753L.S.0a.02]|nr:HD-GYP domain-containing protein (c-di-GMP phosphodiesterase class II) [Alteromonadaceae bacterium 2753L.S.0a.02]
MPKTVKMHVGELRVGMFVSKLDRDWLDTPFIMQGFLLEEQDDIEIVAEFCEYVWVDTDYSSKVSGPSSGVGTASQARAGTAFAGPSVSIQEEHRKTYKTFREARSLTKSLLDDIRLGGALDGSSARDMVNDCVQSVIRHPDALLWMSKIRDEREYTAEHCLNVCIMSIAFGRQLGMDEQELHNLGFCGLLHDVGKMRVPQEIVDKPASLTPKEMRLMKAHTVHGRNLLLASSNIFNGAIDVAYSHHERIDGTGYPRKLPGHGISRYSRIVALVDAYDAMTADRCYAPAKTSTEALKIIYNEKGKQFDEALAIKFIETIGLYPAGSIVELYSGDVGIVIESNPKLRHLPKVILLLDETKSVREKEVVKDLSHIESGELPRRFLIKQVWRDGSFDIRLREYQKKGLIIKH